MTYSAGPSRFTTEEENLQLARQAQAEYEAQQQQLAQPFQNSPLHCICNLYYDELSLFIF